jgi:hypothetical protein
MRIARGVPAVRAAIVTFRLVDSYLSSHDLRTTCPVPTTGKWVPGR